MKNYLKHHRMRITALSPVYIGSGDIIGKKEYIYLRHKNLVIIPDMQKMYKELLMRHRNEFTKFMMWNSKMKMTDWLKSMGYREADFRRWALYELDAGDVLLKGDDPGEKRPFEIHGFTKDPYGLPYVPGSSVKGALRTALLAYEITRNSDKYRSDKNSVYNATERSADRVSRTRYLSNEVKDLESRAFNTLNRKQDRPKDAVNSNMSGLIISDSMPAGLDDLTLCQKVDYHVDGSARTLPLFYEALKPGTKIEFDITIDSSLCPYTIGEINEAVYIFQKICYERYYSAFGRGTDKEGTMWLGGNTGFITKTVIYPLMKENGYITADNVLKATIGKNYKIHKHTQNRSLRLAPHICKCTYYNNELYDMGMCMLEQIED